MKSGDDDPFALTFLEETVRFLKNDESGPGRRYGGP
jgi:hypothetical protein